MFSSIKCTVFVQLNVHVLVPARNTRNGGNNVRQLQIKHDHDGLGTKLLVKFPRMVVMWGFFGNRCLYLTFTCCVRTETIFVEKNFLVRFYSNDHWSNYTVQIGLRKSLHTKGTIMDELAVAQKINLVLTSELPYRACHQLRWKRWVPLPKHSLQWFC